MSSASHNNSLTTVTALTSPRHSDQVHVENWAGSVAVVLTLAANSNSSSTLPAPIHVQVSRHSFLHVALAAAVRRLHAFAPPTFLGGGWSREEPAAGALFRQQQQEDSDDDDDDNNKKKNNNGDQAPQVNDRLKPAEDKISPTTGTTRSKEKAEEASYPVCWFEDEDTQTALRWHLFAGVLFDLKQQPSNPWRIRLHFTTYPSSQILPLENGNVLYQVRSVFKNSLKQAMCLHYGNSKPALNLTKESHGKIWDAISTANYHLYKQGHANLPKQSSTRVPVRVLHNGGPLIQRPCLGADHLTLGAVLHTALPNIFDDNGLPKEDGDVVVDWRIAGLSKPPLDVLVQNYWVNLAHPDHFLYIIVTTNR